MTNRRAVKVLVKEAFISLQKTWKDRALTPDNQLFVDRVDHSQDERQTLLTNTCNCDDSDTCSKLRHISFTIYSPLAKEQVSLYFSITILRELNMIFSKFLSYSSKNLCPCKILKLIAKTDLQLQKEDESQNASSVPAYWCSVIFQESSL